MPTSAKALFEKIPTSGLTFCGPGVKFGPKGLCHFSFDSSGRPLNADKAEYKEAPITFSACYKPGKIAKHVVFVKRKMSPEFVFMKQMVKLEFDATIKYEGSKEGPEYSCSCDYDGKPYSAKFKFNPTNGGFAKIEGSFSRGVFVLFGEAKRKLWAVDPEMTYHMGVTCSSWFGTQNLSCNQKGEVTVDHCLNDFPIKSMAIAAQVTHGFGSSQVEVPVACAAQYVFSKGNSVRCKLNSKGELSIGVKKVFAPQFIVVCGTFFDLNNGWDLLKKAPVLGFRVTMKH